MKLSIALAFLSGFVALSYEIVWYRAYSFTSGGAASSFSLMLGAYLVGLAGGSLLSRRYCEGWSGPLVRMLLWANLLGFSLVPAVSWLVTSDWVAWTGTLPLVALASAGLGTLFPLATHASVAPDARAGLRIAYVQIANILGSAAGSFVTGFLLFEWCSLRTVAIVLGILGLALPWAVYGAGATPRSRRWGPIAGFLAVAVALPFAAAILYDGVYERLQTRIYYRPGFRFAHVIENRSGVITVDPDGTVYGGGVFDGMYGTTVGAQQNEILRMYVLGGLHPAPREVLQIGLSTGSWATVIARDPRVERLTVVEINPGYLQLLSKRPEVSGLLENPKVRIEIDDGRRWLVRNGDRRFDAILWNVWASRAHSSNLFSVEFLDLVRSRLKPGGLAFCNTTGSERVLKTVASHFPHAFRYTNMAAAGDAPIGFDPARFLQLVRAHRAAGHRVFTVPDDEWDLHAEKLSRGIAGGIEPRESILARTASQRIITDDNMGAEWRP